MASHKNVAQVSLHKFHNNDHLALYKFNNNDNQIK
uniref:Uncharacterized protein n=1 Tax=Gloeothece verrucosa (strain PCC 7822) TaxID=497965 RepID=E0U5E3_GLOV7|nr:hypothetical protein Cyan7822_1540 [Gloeothece verrucosa PCC 7822]